MDHFLNHPLFKEAIQNQAKHLAEKIMKGTLPAEAIEQQIVAHIRLCSTQKSNQKALAELSVPRVSTYLAALSARHFDALANYATNNISEAGPLGFVGEAKPLHRYLVDGLLDFTFPPEFRNFMKALFMLNDPALAGQNVKTIQAMTARYTAEASMTPTLIGQLTVLVKEQIADIRSGALPKPPADMGVQWDIRRSPESILNILSAMQCLDLYRIAEMAGFSRDNAHLAFGLASREILQQTNLALIALWEDAKPALLAGVGVGLKRLQAELAMQPADYLAHLQLHAQPAGINLMVKPPKPEPMHAPREQGLFGNANAEVPAVAVAAAAIQPKTKAELAREAAEKRLAVKPAAAALAVVAAPAAAAAAIPPAQPMSKAARLFKAAEERLQAAAAPAPIATAAAAAAGYDSGEEEEERARFA